MTVDVEELKRRVWEARLTEYDNPAEIVDQIIDEMVNEPEYEWVERRLYSADGIPAGKIFNCPFCSDGNDYAEHDLPAYCPICRKKLVRA